MGAKRGRPPETSREHIRDVAHELFRAQGYAATSLQQIADAAGISRTTLFHHFPAKRDLMAVESRADVARLERALQEASGASAVDGVVAGLIAAAAYSRQEREALIQRWRIVRGEAELRADVDALTGEVADSLHAFALERAPHTEPDLVRDVVDTLLAVAARATVAWADRDGVDLDLNDYARARLEPFRIALGPLLD